MRSQSRARRLGGQVCPRRSVRSGLAADRVLQALNQLHPADERPDLPAVGDHASTDRGVITICLDRRAPGHFGHRGKCHPARSAWHRGATTNFAPPRVEGDRGRRETPVVARTTIAPIEREAELAAVARATAAARAGDGQTLFFTGPAGLGKTLLLDTVAARAPGLVLRARGHVSEATLAYGVLRQLMEDVVDELGPDERCWTAPLGRAAAAGPWAVAGTRGRPRPRRPPRGLEAARRTGRAAPSADGGRR